MNNNNTFWCWQKWVKYSSHINVNIIIIDTHKLVVELIASFSRRPCIILTAPRYTRSHANWAAMRCWLGEKETHADIVSCALGKRVNEKTLKMVRVLWPNVQRTVYTQGSWSRCQGHFFQSVYTAGFLLHDCGPTIVSMYSYFWYISVTGTIIGSLTSDFFSFFFYFF